MSRSITLPPDSYNVLDVGIARVVVTIDRHTIAGRQMVLHHTPLCRIERDAVGDHLRDFAIEKSITISAGADRESVDVPCADAAGSGGSTIGCQR